MGAQLQFIDIIIFAVIAVLLVLRLRSVLGQRTGYEQPQDESRANRFDDTENDNEPIPLHPKAADEPPVALHWLDAMRQFDRSFYDKLITLDDIREASILNIAMIDQLASITVHFHSVQTRIAKDENDEVIEADESGAREFTDIWTFERDLTLSDPNWKLVETESESAED